MGVSKAKIFKGKYETKLEFPEGWGLKPKNPLYNTISIGNHMILSVIWDKSAHVNFSKTNKIVRARRASAIFSRCYTILNPCFVLCTRVTQGSILAIFQTRQPGKYVRKDTCPDKILLARSKLLNN